MSTTVHYVFDSTRFKYIHSLSVSPILHFFCFHRRSDRDVRANTRLPMGGGAGEDAEEPGEPPFGLLSGGIQPAFLYPPTGAPVAPATPPPPTPLPASPPGAPPPATPPPPPPIPPPAPPTLPSPPAAPAGPVGPWCPCGCCPPKAAANLGVNNSPNSHQYFPLF